MKVLPPSKWSGRDDGTGAERIHQCVKFVEANVSAPTGGKSYAFLGFASDEGVKRNLGRVGASKAPEAIRSTLSNLAWNVHAGAKLLDAGDVPCIDRDLEAAQKTLGEAVHSLLQKNYTPIVLGGGHETAWGHFQGLAKHKKNILIINFDAHYDMRPLVDGKFGTSGTPFGQIADFCEKEKRPFNYICIGVQESANTLALRTRAKNSNVQSIHARTLHSEGLLPTLAFLDKQLAFHEAVYLTVCMDVFSQAYAPGVSAPQALGLLPWHVIPILHKIKKSGKLLSADFVELCPPLDLDNRTAKLCSSLIWELLSDDIMTS